MSINLDEIKARAEAATVAPWAWLESLNHVYGGFGYEADQPGSVICNEPEFDDREADMIFIANARADIPALIAEIERLQAVNGQLVEACQAFVDAWEKSHQLEKTDVALWLAKAALEAARQE